jgi:hypothetical protein
LNAFDLIAGVFYSGNPVAENGLLIHVCLIATTDYVYYKTASVDKGIPKNGIKLDQKPLGMPSYHECEDELCLIGSKK